MGPLFIISISLLAIANGALLTLPVIGKTQMPTRVAIGAVIGFAALSWISFLTALLLGVPLLAQQPAQQPAVQPAQQPPADPNLDAALASWEKAMGNIQSQETSNPCSISQYAALAALEGDQECVEKMRREFEARRDLVCKRLAALPGVRCPVPDGAFYAFFNVAAHSGRTLGGKKVTDSASVCAAALEAAHVNLVQGSAFGAEGYVRLSFAASRETLTAGLDRLEQFLT